MSPPIGAHLLRLRGRGAAEGRGRSQEGGQGGWRGGSGGKRLLPSPPRSAPKRLPDAEVRQREPQRAGAAPWKRPGLWGGGKQKEGGAGGEEEGQGVPLCGAGAAGQRLTRDVQQREVAAARGLRGQREIKVVASLGLVPVHNADGVDQLQGEAEPDSEPEERGGDKP